MRELGRAPRENARPFIVGANMPWIDAGHDFGFKPHGWGQRRPDWNAVAAQLAHMRALGIRVVRWFVLAGGVNYPNPMRGLQPPVRENGAVEQAIDHYARRVYLAEAGVFERAYHRGLELVGMREPVPPSAEPEAGFVWEWTGDPPPLSAEFIEDFVSLCRACRAADVQLLPSLLSFEWFQDLARKAKGVCSGARARLIFGPPGRGDARAHVRRFLAATFEPLLDRIQREFGSHAAAGRANHPIFAWESINEPDWVVEGAPRLLTNFRQPVTAADMNALLDEFRELALGAGFDHSIGFKQLEPAWLDAALRAALIADGPRYWHQAHHYPMPDLLTVADAFLDTDRTLAPRPGAFANCLVGEFPTRQGGLRPDNARWGDAELAATERDRSRYLRGRWELMRQRGYDGALLWCARAPAPDARVCWDAETWRQTRDFARACGGLRVPGEG